MSTAVRLGNSIFELRNIALNVVELFRRRPGPPNMEGARRYAGSVCISLTRKRTMFVYYSSLFLIFRLPRTSWHIGTLRATLTVSTNWLEFSYMQ